MSTVEKVALDLTDSRYIGKYILIGVDYFTRYVWVELMENKRAEIIVNV